MVMEKIWRWEGEKKYFKCFCVLSQTFAFTQETAFARKELRSFASKNFLGKRKILARECKSTDKSFHHSHIFFHHCALFQSFIHFHQLSTFTLIAQICLTRVYSQSIGCVCVSQYSSSEEQVVCVQKVALSFPM